MSLIHEIFFIVLTSVVPFCFSLEEFYCKAVDGCEIDARCDPSPFSRAHLTRNEFPIKCVSDDASKEKCCENKMKAVLSKLEDLTEEIKELRKEKKELDDKVVNIDQLKKDIANLQELNQINTDDIAQVKSALKQQKRKDKVTDEKLGELKNRLQEVNETLQELGNNDGTKEFCSNHNGILYNGTCLWEEQRPAEMTLAEAYRKCNSVTPSKLPEFYNEEQYNQLMDFFRSKIPSGKTYIQTWLGLTRNHWTGKAILSNGEPAPYAEIKQQSRNQWLDGSLTRTNAYLDARKSISSAYNGMGAVRPSYNYEDDVATLLCQTLPFIYKPKFKSIEDEVWCQNIGGIAYNGSCLWAEDAPDDMTLSTALEVCNKRTPSKLPEVYGGQEYIKIMEYMRTKIETTSIIAWTAMTRNIMTNQAMLSDGTPAPYTKPRTKDGRWEDATDDKTNVYLVATVDTTLNDQGMGARPPTYRFSIERKIVIRQKL